MARAESVSGDTQIVYFTEATAAVTPTAGAASGSYTYAAMDTAADAATEPPNWRQDWVYPPEKATGPWPPGWPWTITGTYTLTLTVPATISTSAVAIIAQILDGDSNDTDTFDEYYIRIRAAVGSTTLRIKENANDDWVSEFHGRINNYTGTKYGISKSLFFDTAGESGTITLTFDIFGIVDGDGDSFSNTDTAVIA